MIPDKKVSDTKVSDKNVSDNKVREEFNRVRLELAHKDVREAVMRYYQKKQEVVWLLGLIFILSFGMTFFFFLWKNNHPFKYANAQWELKKDLLKNFEKAQKHPELLLPYLRHISASDTVRISWKINVDSSKVLNIECDYTCKGLPNHYWRDKINESMVNYIVNKHYIGMDTLSISLLDNWDYRIIKTYSLYYKRYEPYMDSVYIK